MIRRYIKKLFRQLHASNTGADENLHREPPEIIPSQLGLNQSSYLAWIAHNTISQSEIELISQAVKKATAAAKFTILLPITDAREDRLLVSINSLLAQLYPHWSLRLLDIQPNSQAMAERLAAMDPRISYSSDNSPTQITATNDSDYIGFIYPGGELSIDALFENAQTIARSRGVEYLYSDEDRVNKNGQREKPIFKPDFSPDLLDSQNYFGNLLIIRGDVFNKLNSLNAADSSRFNHAQLLRLAPQCNCIVHIPKVLYHQHVDGNTLSPADGLEAIQRRLEDRAEPAQVLHAEVKGTYRVKRAISGSPKVSVIIPFKDHPQLLYNCVSSLFEHAAYQNLEVIGVSNNSTEPATAETVAKLTAQYSNLRIVEKNIPFNFSALCNFGVSKSSGDYILLLNNDIQITSDHWISALLEHAQRPEIGAVGGKLYYPDGRIQHAGIVAGMHGLAGHSHLYFANDDPGYLGALSLSRNVSAVTGALMMISRDKYDLVGGLNEQNLAVAYNDVDICFKLIEAGYRNIFTPYCQAIHNESASRGYEDTPEKQARLEKERLFFLEKWGAFIEKGDPYFNKNFDLAYHDYRLKPTNN